MKLVIVALLISLAALVVAVRDAYGHEWYTGQRAPSGRICCGGRDCAALPADTRIAMTGDGFNVTIVPGTHPMVTVERFGREPVTFHYTGHVTNPSPDGQVHACIWGDDVKRKSITCLMYGGTM